MILRCNELKLRAKRDSTASIPENLVTARIHRSRKRSRDFSRPKFATFLGPILISRRSGKIVMAKALPRSFRLQTTSSTPTIKIGNLRMDRLRHLQKFLNTVAKINSKCTPMKRDRSLELFRAILVHRLNRLRFSNSKLRLSRIMSRNVRRSLLK